MRRGLAVEKGLASFSHRLVIHEDMDRPLGLGVLRVLRDPVNAGSAVETVACTVVRGEHCASQEWDGLM